MEHARVLLDGLAIGESARWHEGRLWFAHWGRGEIVAVTPEGEAEVMAAGPAGLGWSIDWLPDGTLLVTGQGLRRLLPDGTLAPYADLAAVAPGYGFNEIVVDARGNVYVNGTDFDFGAGEPPRPGIIVLVTPAGDARQVAAGIEFPNGMVISPDGRTLVISESFARRLTAFDIEGDGSLANRRVWADGIGPDGICMDAEGCIWTSPDIGGGRSGEACIRVREGGEVLDRVALEHGAFSCMLGGEDGRTLFMLTADWWMDQSPTDNIARLVDGPPTGRLLCARPAPARRAGRP